MMTLLKAELLVLSPHKRSCSNESVGGTELSGVEGNSKADKKQKNDSFLICVIVNML